MHPPSNTAIQHSTFHGSTDHIQRPENNCHFTAAPQILSLPLIKSIHTSCTFFVRKKSVGYSHSVLTQIEVWSDCVDVNKSCNLLWLWLLQEVYSFSYFQTMVFIKTLNQMLSYPLWVKFLNKLDWSIGNLALHCSKTWTNVRYFLQVWTIQLNLIMFFFYFYPVGPILYS